MQSVVSLNGTIFLTPLESITRFKREIRDYLLNTEYPNTTQVVQNVYVRRMKKVKDSQNPPLIILTLSPLLTSAGKSFWHIRHLPGWNFLSSILIPQVACIPVCRNCSILFTEATSLRQRAQGNNKWLQVKWLGFYVFYIFLCSATRSVLLIQLTSNWMTSC